MADVLDIALWIVAGMWVVLLLQLLLNWRLIRDIEEADAALPTEWPFVSIVVPARDEEGGIAAAVSSFCTQDYPTFEVIVVDDRSTDATPTILADLQTRYDNLKVVPGSDPPPGWLGKPNAIETGRRHANGEWMLFVDADVVYAPDLLRRAVAYAVAEEAGMLFLYPSVTVGGVLEAAIMSTLYIVPFALVPIFLISRTRTGLLAIGGGAFNLVRRDALESCNAFECIKAAVVDDVGLGYAVKRAGFKQALALGGSRIRIRMYNSGRATIEGFTKNAYPGICRYQWVLPVPFVAGMLGSLLPYYGFVAALAAGTVNLPASIALVCMHCVMAGIARIFHQPWYITFLNPLRELGWWWIMARSFVRYQRRGLIWRGRNYAAPT